MLYPYNEGDSPSLLKFDYLCLFIFKGIAFVTLKLISFFSENDGKSLCIFERFFYNGGMFNLYRLFLKGVLLYNKVDKCCPLPYSLPSGSSANLTARHEVPSFALVNVL